MRTYIRLFIAILIILGLVALAKSNVAWAAKLSSNSPASRLLSAQNDKDGCDKNPNSSACKDKDKCKKKDNCGSVKPPPKNVIITVTGQYSVGGFCTLDVEFLAANLRLDANVITPLPRPLPENLHKVGLGCILTYYRADQQTDGLHSEDGKTTICFAATPQKEMQIYFYDYFSATPGWSSLVTTKTDGMICAAANQSGIYVPTFASKQ